MLNADNFHAVNAFNLTLHPRPRSPVKIAKIEKKKKNRVVLKIGVIVEGNVLNNILKVLADRR